MAISWHPALAVGHAEIDGQHQEMFRRADGLVEALRRADHVEAVRHFDFLGSYAAEHFDAEERLMREVGFPGYAVHKLAHDRFVRDYHALRALYEKAGPVSAVTVKAGTWLSDWLARHIAGTDQHLARHIRRRP